MLTTVITEYNPYHLSKPRDQIAPKIMHSAITPYICRFDIYVYPFIQGMHFTSSVNNRSEAIMSDCILIKSDGQLLKPGFHIIATIVVIVVVAQKN